MTKCAPSTLYPVFLWTLNLAGGAKYDPLTVKKAGVARMTEYQEEQAPAYNATNTFIVWI